MAVPAEVYPGQDPLSAMSPSESAIGSPDMGDITAFSPLNPYTMSSVTSGIMPLQLDNTNVPPPVLDLRSPEGELQDHETIQFNNYSMSSSSGGYRYTEYNAASTPYYDQGHVGPHDTSSREGTTTPEFGHRNMPLYHQHTPQSSITSP
jgi:hypothetical protein